MAKKPVRPPAGKPAAPPRKPDPQPGYVAAYRDCPVPMYVGVYRHHRGTDVAVYVSREQALLGLLEVVLENIADGTDTGTSAADHAAIGRLYTAGRYADALALFNEAGVEFMEVTETYLCPPVDPWPPAAVAEMLDEVGAAKPEET